jgi:hypothetical protein
LLNGTYEPKPVRRVEIHKLMGQIAKRVDMENTTASPSGTDRTAPSFEDVDLTTTTTNIKHGSGMSLVRGEQSR